MTGRDEPVVVPEPLEASLTRYFGAEGRRWVAGLPALARTWLERWDLQRAGMPAYGQVALVLPVRRADGTDAVLKLQPVDEETRGEGAALRCWSGHGAVELLAEDPGSGTLLLQRLDADRSLVTVEDDLAAVRVIAELLRRLHAVPAPVGLRRLADAAEAMVAAAPQLLPAVLDPDERRMLARGAARVGELLSGPVPDRLLHWDLHYANVLALPGAGPAASPQWRAIDPKPLVGHPAFDLLPALWNRWDDVVASGDVARAVRRRFDLMTEVLELDRDLAVGWTLARVLQNGLWAVRDQGAGGLQAEHRAVAEALSARTG